MRGGSTLVTAAETYFMIEKRLCIYLHCIKLPKVVTPLDAVKRQKRNWKG